MLVYFSRAGSDYSTNGTRVLDPYIMMAELHEDESECRLTMELAPDKRLICIKPEGIIRCPAPVMPTPEVNTAPDGGTLVYATTSSILRYAKPNDSSAKLARYSAGTEVIVTDTSGSFFAVITPDGRKGYMKSQYLTYKRTEGGAPAEVQGYSEQVGEQLFRVQSVDSTIESVRIEARHIRYDLKRYVLGTVKSTNGRSAAAVAAIFEGTGFSIIGDMDKSAEYDFSGKTAWDAIYDAENGLLAIFGGTLFFDNYTVYWTERVGKDKGYMLAFGKNVTSLSVVSEVVPGETVTRIIPVGQNKSGKEILLDEVYIDAANASDYDTPLSKRIVYSDVKVGDKYSSIAAVKEELRTRANAEFNEKQVCFPKLSATVGYADFVAAGGNRAIFIGDGVYVVYPLMGIKHGMRINGYTFDPVSKTYVEIELGERHKRLGELTIPAYLIPDNALTGRKFAEGSVTEASIVEGAVSPDKLSADALRYRVEVIPTKTILSSTEDTITLSARVYDGDSEITGTLDASCFSWSRVSGDATADLTWSGAGKSITIGASDIDRFARYICTVDSGSGGELASGTYLTDASGAVLTTGSGALLIL